MSDMFSRESLARDLPASVVVFFVALPLCLGIALASGAPLFSGLIAGVVGGIVVGAVSRSQLGVSGPAAGLTVIVLGAIAELGSFEAFLCAVVLAGLLQVALGVLRAGVLGYFFPSSVINGMLTGIGLIIVLKQIPHAFGYDSDPEGDLSFQQPDGGTTLSALGEMLGNIHPGALLIAAISLGLLILWETPLVKSRPRLAALPGPVVAVTVAIGLQFALADAGALAVLDSHLVAVPVAANFGEFLSFFTVPDLSLALDPRVWAVALTLAVVASLETLLSVEAIDKLDPEKRVTPTNRELVAQGIGNSVSGLIGGLPVTQVIVRSSVNVQTGARSQLSAILHGVLLLLFVAVVPEVLNMIPLAVLAAVLLMTGYKLARPALFRAMWANGTEQFVPFIVTVTGVVFIDLLAGVGLGMAAAVVLLLQRNYLNSHFLHIEEGEDGARHVVTMSLAEEVSFLNKGAIRRELDRITADTRVVIDASRCVAMNYDVRELIEEFMSVAPARNVEVDFIEAPAERDPTERGLREVA